jgi:Xaa-Pro dipeptidase
VRIDRLSFSGLQALALVGTTNINYLTSFKTTPFERLIALVVTAQGELRAVVPSLEEEAASTALPDAAACFIWRDEDGPAEALAAAFTGVTGRVGIEAEQLRVAQLDLFRSAAPNCTFVAADDVMANARIRKDAEELEALQRACVILDTAFARVAEESLSAGRTELDVAEDCARFVREAGGSTSGFTPIVLTGARSALPHGKAGDTSLTTGDLVVIDFGACYRGYFSDATRTFVVGGSLSARQRGLFEAVHRAEQAGIAAVRPGAAARDVDIAARSVLADAGLADYFVHRTGHGLGLDVHEPPWLNGSNDQILTEDMVVTVEPGVYIPGFGGVRIEDDIRVADPPEVLTHAPIVY